MDSFTVIDNIFFNEFLPQATGDDVKVYLYCLNLCNNPNIEDNNLDSICKVLSLTEEQVKSSCQYWQEMGLIQIVSMSPFEIRFLPIRTHSGSNKIRHPEKYSDFNDQMNKVISGRMITPTEFNEYYSLIETYHFEPDALILIAKYCTQIKSNSIGYPYILAVARNFANDGLKTFESVERKFLEQEKSSVEIKQVLSALGLSRESDLEERNLYLKWTNNFGFTQGVIVEVAKSQKRRGGFVKLDELLTKYYEQKLFTIQEIQNYSSIREGLFETAREVCSIIGVYYQVYENVVDTYISDWTNKGYEKDSLIFIANYCFKQSIRTLDGMNVVIQKFYKLGLITLESIKQYISNIIENDEIIKEILDIFGLLRSVSSNDREMFRTWTTSWGFTEEQILEVAKLLKNSGYNLSYMNKTLSSLNNLGIKDSKEIEKYITNLSQNQSKPKKNYNTDITTREYSKEELSALYDSLDDIEI